MNGVNKATIVGTMGKNPDLKYTAAGSAITRISVATSEKWTDKNTGEKKELTEWHNITFFGKAGETLNKYTKKGSRIYIEGKIQTRKWQDNSGDDRYTTEIIGREFQLLDRNPNTGNNEQKPAAPAAHQQFDSPPADDGFDDIPF